VLIEIRCDKFLDNGVIRDPITFKPGLNAIVGDSEKSNSIGKSTMLMIIDFCFGGDDYTTKEADTINHVGNHTIFFTFKFKGQKYYYSRSTNNPKIIYEYYDSDYTREKKKIHYESFKKDLLHQYELDDLGLTFRQIVGRFFRIYNRKTHNEMRPLNADVREDDKSGIEFLLKMYSLYGDLDDQTKEYDTANDKKKLYDNLRRYKAGFIASNKDEYEKNKKEIKSLEDELELLLQENKKGLSETNIVNASIKNELKSQRDKLRYQKRQEEKKLKEIDFDNSYEEESLTSKFSSLQEFFPEIDIQNITKYEKFHRDVKKIISKEIKENRKDIEDSIAIIDEKISELNIKLAEFKEIPDVSEAILARHNQIHTRLNELRNANENYDKREIAVDELKRATNGYEQAINAKTSTLQKIVNQGMSEINNSFENGNKYPPVLQINSLKSYAFNTPNDTGTGSRFKGVAVFDLEILKSTLLPAIIHDSIMFTNIEDPTVATLLSLYEEQTSKQIFIAFDKFDNRGNDIDEILNRNKVLQLSDEPHALFGNQWNKKEEDNGQL